MRGKGGEDFGEGSRACEWEEGGVVVCDRRFCFWGFWRGGVRVEVGRRERERDREVGDEVSLEVYFGGIFDRLES